MVSNLVLSISIVNVSSSAGVTLNVLENESLYWDKRACASILNEVSVECILSTMVSMTSLSLLDDFSSFFRHASSQLSYSIASLSSS